MTSAALTTSIFAVKIDVVSAAVIIAAAIRQLNKRFPTLFTDNEIKFIFSFLGKKK